MEEDTITVTSESLDIFFLLVGAVLVFFMQAGFAMLEVGSINVLNLAIATEFILLKNMLDICIAAIMWWLVGYGLAFGDSEGWGGTTKFGLRRAEFESDDADIDGLPSSHGGFQYAAFMFSWAFAGTSTTIVSGAMAERTTQLAYVSVSLLLTSLTYPMIASWAWNDSGWANPGRDNGTPLFGCGVIDFAGSGVVHLTGGTAAFIGCYIIGPRRAFVANTLRTPMYGTTYKCIGTFILWMGWFAFNGMSTMAIVGRTRTAARAMVNTAIAGASGSLFNGVLGGVLEARLLAEGPFAIKLNETINGTLGGLVAITASCALVEPFGAFIIGALSAPVNTFASFWMKRRRIDDVVDATPIHGFCGLLGLVMASCFATQKNYREVYGVSAERAEQCAGIFYGGQGRSLAAALVFAMVIVTWVVATCGVLFKALARSYLLRVSIAAEEAGLDDSAHGDHSLSALNSLDGSEHAGVVKGLVNDADIDRSPSEERPWATSNQQSGPANHSASLDKSGSGSCSGHSEGSDTTPTKMSYGGGGSGFGGSASGGRNSRGGGSVSEDRGAQGVSQRLLNVAPELAFELQFGRSMSQSGKRRLSRNNSASEKSSNRAVSDAASAGSSESDGGSLNKGSTERAPSSSSAAAAAAAAARGGGGGGSGDDWETVISTGPPTSSAEKDKPIFVSSLGHSDVLTAIRDGSYESDGEGGDDGTARLPTITTDEEV